MITSQKDLRHLFWSENAGGYKRQYRNGKPLDQNQYAADVRMAWVDFVDACVRNGVIDEALASRATLK
jgi:hypothetical protein